MKGRKTEQRVTRKNRGGSSKNPPAAKPGPLRKKISGDREKGAFEDLVSRRELLLEPGELPVSYGVTRVVLLPVEPYLVNVYWDISPGGLKKISRLTAGPQPSQPILRFHDVTRRIQNSKAHTFFDITVDLSAGNWYVHLWSAEKSYFVELGLSTADGRFFPVARSNTAKLPPSRPLAETGERSILLTEDYDAVKTIPAATLKKPLKGAPPPPLPEHAMPPPSAGPYRESPLEKNMGKNDLTEMSERNFFFGISSGSSVPDRKGHDPLGG